MCRRNLPVFYRLAPHLSFARVLHRDCWSGVDLGVVIERPALLAPLARYPGGRWGLGTGVERESWQPARAAPAERECKGIRALPGPKDSPRTSRFIKAAARKGQPSPAGGRRYALRADRPAEAFFSFGPSTAHFLFGKTEKKMGGWNPAVITACPAPSDAPHYLPGNPSHAAAKASPSNAVS